MKSYAVMRHLRKFLSTEFDSILLTPTFNRSREKALHYAEIAEDSNNNPLLQSDATQIEELDANWNQTLNECEAVLSKTVQFQYSLN